MGRKNIIEKTRVYVECTDMHRRIKGKVLTQDEKQLTVEFPTGAVMALTRRHKKGEYTFQAGLLEFISDGKLVI